MSGGDEWRTTTWAAIARGLLAHVVMLRDVAILDDQSAASLLTAIDSVHRGEPPAITGSLALVAAFDERFDSLTPAGSSGAGRIARARHDLAATAQRLVLRDQALTLASALDVARGALIDLAEGHVFTLMPAWSGSALLQPTNLAHFLTGTTAPLGRSAQRLHNAYDVLDRSAMGAGALAGPGFPVDRDEIADLLGMEGPIQSTFDALCAVDYLIAVAEAASSIVGPIRRLLIEFTLWLRTDPHAIRLADELLAPVDLNLPHFRPPATLERVIADARAVEETASTIAHTVSETPYGPVGEMGDRAVALAGSALHLAASVAELCTTLVSGPIEINRAWLARNAGRDLITLGDLGDFLMAEEGLDPASARDIAALTAHRARQEGLEASGITPPLIDAAALLVIGRELGIEIERLGAYLAPRRFVEKRTMLGGPAPAAVRELLQGERTRLEADQRWLEGKRQRIALAEANLEIRMQEILSAANTG